MNAARIILTGWTWYASPVLRHRTGTERDGRMRREAGRERGGRTKVDHLA